LDSANKLRTNQKDELLQKQLALKTVEKEIDVLERERQLDQETILLLEKEQEVNNSALQQQRILLYVLGFIITIFIFIAILVYRNTKAKNRANQLLHLKNLRAQMNPHFIFNSLNSVNNYIAKSNERAANKYLAKFSRLMRMVLDYSQVEFISLTNEVELLRLYVELEHERFKDKFHYVFEVDETINTEQFQIPPMIVQPFIENAVWHGLCYKKEEGQLSIYFRDRGDHVEIEVSDDGIGRTKSQEIKTVNQKKHKSSGMRNIENRTEMIRSLFRKKIDYEISDLSEGKGTRVIIKLFDHE
jgi:LytS/YehU family sensor histidine kinase